VWRGLLASGVESAAFPGQTDEEVKRLMHMVVVGGGPTGVEYAAELHDFLTEDLKKWYPEVADHLKITLVEALPNVLPMFSRKLIEYTESTFSQNQIELLTKTMVKDVQEKHIVVQDANKEIREIPFGLLVWATGNTSRQITRNLMGKLADVQTVRRGIATDDNFEMLGAEGVFAIGDNAATKYAPTAQVAAQQGAYLAKTFKQLAKRDAAIAELEQLKTSTAATDAATVEAAVKKVTKLSKIRPFQYSHQGSLAYIGSDKAIADLPIFGADNLTSVGGQATYWFWRSAYIVSRGLVPPPPPLPSSVPSCN
jgi:NADH:ubiquinone reductase (non-electrogenic)